MFCCLHKQEIEEVDTDEQYQPKTPIGIINIILKGGVLVRGLEEKMGANVNEIFSLLEKGSAKRQTAHTVEQAIQVEFTPCLLLNCTSYSNFKRLLPSVTFQSIALHFLNHHSHKRGNPRRRRTNKMWEVKSG